MELQPELSVPELDMILSWNCHSNNTWVSWHDFNVRFSVDVDNDGHPTSRISASDIRGERTDIKQFDSHIKTILRKIRDDNLIAKAKQQHDKYTKWADDDCNSRMLQSLFRAAKHLPKNVQRSLSMTSKEDLIAFAKAYKNA